MCWTLACSFHNFLLFDVGCTYSFVLKINKRKICDHSHTFYCGRRKWISPVCEFYVLVLLNLTSHAKPQVLRFKLSLSFFMTFQDWRLPRHRVQRGYYRWWHYRTMIIMTHINVEITTFDNGGFPEVSKNFFKLLPFSIPSIYLNCRWKCCTLPGITNYH